MTPRHLSIYVGRNEKREVTHHFAMAKKKDNSCCFAQKSLKTPIKPIGETLTIHTHFMKEISERVHARETYVETYNGP